MNIHANKAPALICTFNASNGAAEAAYPWTDPEDVRPAVSGVDSQWVAAASKPWQIASNRLRNVAGANSASGIDLGAPVRRAVINMENDESVNLGTAVGILIRGNSDLTEYLSVELFRIGISGAFRFQVLSEPGGSLGSLTITPDTVPTTLQSFEVLDDGENITINFSGQSYTLSTSQYAGNTLVGVTMSASATELQHAENLSAWI